MIELAEPDPPLTTVEQLLEDADKLSLVPLEDDEFTARLRRAGFLVPTSERSQHRQETTP
jgi:hypothetical protein